MYGNTIRVIIVEDEPELRDNLMIGLSSHGLDVIAAGNGVELDAALSRHSADIILLDLGLPGEDGLDIAKRLRTNEKLGVIMLTARGMTQDRIQGLHSGADSYFVKPVNIAELAAAIHNLGRRVTRRPSTAWRLNADASCLYTPHNTSITLTSQECLLLQVMFKHVGQTVPREEIFTAIGQPPQDTYSNARLEVLISRLRSKVLKTKPAMPLPLRARHNAGYIFLADDTP